MERHGEREAAGEIRMRFGERHRSGDEAGHGRGR